MNTYIHLQRLKNKEKFYQHCLFIAMFLFWTEIEHLNKVWVIVFFLYNTFVDSIEFGVVMLLPSLIKEQKQNFKI